MKTRYLAHLQPRSAPTLRCGHTDCCYYTRDTDSCDYLLIEYRRRGCPPTPDCPCFAPAGRARSAPEAELGARIQAYTDMGQSVRQIARRLRISEVGEAVGFVSSAHFSHVFKKNTGCTPTAYRESCKDPEDH